MEAFVENLQIEVQAKLDKVDLNLSVIEEYNAKIEIMEWAITEMRRYLWLHPFPDKYISRSHRCNLLAVASLEKS